MKGLKFLLIIAAAILFGFFLISSRGKSKLVHERAYVIEKPTTVGEAPLELKVTTDKQDYFLNDEIKLIFLLKNISKKPVGIFYDFDYEPDLNFQTISFNEKDNKLRWYFSGGQYGSYDPVKHTILNPNELIEHTQTWGKLKKGKVFGDSVESKSFIQQNILIHDGVFIEKSLEEKILLPNQSHINMKFQSKFFSSQHRDFGSVIKNCLTENHNLPWMSDSSKNYIINFLKEQNLPVSCQELLLIDKRIWTGKLISNPFTIRIHNE